MMELGDGKCLAEAWRIFRTGGSAVVLFDDVDEVNGCRTGASRPPT